MKQFRELTGKELFDFMIANKQLIINQKKSAVKYTDAFSFSKSFVNRSGDIVKMNVPVAGDITTLNISVVINTTNFIDSHDDVHMPGIWKKSLSENKSLYLLQQHDMSFEGVITDEVDPYTKSMTWKEIGQPYDGSSEALIFDCVIDKNRNPFMFNQYKNGYVKNHSVGMRYVKMEMAINDADYKEEFAVWNTMIDKIANRDVAENSGYFFPVFEAKVVEGSAVVIGSNTATPTLSNNMKSSTESQPTQVTEEQPQQSFMDYISQNKFINF